MRNFIDAYLFSPEIWLILGISVLQHEWEVSALPTEFSSSRFPQQSLPTEWSIWSVGSLAGFSFTLHFACSDHCILKTRSISIQYGALRHRKIQTYAFMCWNPIRPYPRQRRIFVQHLYNTFATVAPDSIQDWYSPERFISSPVRERKAWFSPVRSPASV